MSHAGVRLHASGAIRLFEQASIIQAEVKYTQSAKSRMIGESPHLRRAERLSTQSTSLCYFLKWDYFPNLSQLLRRRAIPSRRRFKHAPFLRSSRAAMSSAVLKPVRVRLLPSACHCCRFCRSPNLKGKTSAPVPWFWHRPASSQLRCIKASLITAKACTCARR